MPIDNIIIAKSIPGIMNVAAANIPITVIPNMKTKSTFSGNYTHML